MAERTRGGGEGVGRTTERPPVFWDAGFVAAHPELFSRPRTGLVEFLADGDGLSRHYALPGSLAAFGAGATAPGGLLRWYGGLHKETNETPSALEARGLRVLSAAQFIAAGRPIIERLTEAAPDLDVAS